MFKIKLEDVEEYEDHLKTFKQRAFPFASKNALNGSAFKARELWQQDIKSEMINRNAYTRNSIRVEQARTLIVSRQAATVGSIAPYMEVQEFGGTKTSPGKEGVAIPTSYAAGQVEQQPRTRLPRKDNKLSNIRLSNRRSKRGTNKQRLLLKVQNAVKTGRRHIFHDFGRTKGLFRVVGGRRSVKRGWPEGAQLRMVYDMSDKTVTIPRNPTLKPVIDKAREYMPEIYIKALRYQLQRHGLFK